MTPLRPDGPDRYRADDGRTMAREHGKTPNGNPIAGRWVLRGSQGEWVGCNASRQDVIEAHGLRLVHPESRKDPELSGPASMPTATSPVRSPAPA